MYHARDRYRRRYGNHRGAPPRHDAVLWLMLSAPLVLDVLAGERPWAPASVLPVVLLAPSVVLCRYRPSAGTVLPVATSLALHPEMFTPLLWPALAVLGFLTGCGTSRARPALWTFAAAGAAGLPLCVLRSPDRLWGWPTMLLTLLFAVVLPWLLGRYRRQHTELVRRGWRLADRMEREQRAVADRARMRERARIAGDMHDSLGHDLTLLAVRAGALELDASLDVRHQQSVRELREAAAAATERLREIIGVLREDGEPASAPLSTQDAASLIGHARASGVAVTADRLDPLTGTPPMTGPAVHRVLQEALTNAAKHAPGADVRVRLERADNVLVLRVDNTPPGRAVPPGVASGGAGLVGLDERVRLAGGVLRSGPTPGGGFEVTAVLPAVAGEACRAEGGPAAAAAGHTGNHDRYGTVGAAPLPGGKGPADGAGSAAAVELALVRRRLRRRTWQAVVGTLVMLAGIVLLMVPVSLITSSLSILRDSAFARLEVGEERAAVDARLPAFPRDGPPDDAPPPPKGMACEYYSTGLMSADAYRLCFADGRLVSKERLGGDGS